MDHQRNIQNGETNENINVPKLTLNKPVDKLIKTGKLWKTKHTDKNQNITDVNESLDFSKL